MCHGESGTQLLQSCDQRTKHTFLFPGFQSQPWAEIREHLRCNGWAHLGQYIDPSINMTITDAEEYGERRGYVPAWLETGKTAKRIWKWQPFQTAIQESER
jgi:hypothetical protein